MKLICLLFKLNNLQNNLSLIIITIIKSPGGKVLIITVQTYLQWMGNKIKIVEKKKNSLNDNF
jgi:hypothetical protein